MLIPLFKQYYVSAQVLGYCAGVANSLVMNKRWTFSQKEPMTRRQLILFLLVNLAALSTGILVLTQEKLGMNRFAGKIVAVVCSMGVNFLGNKLMVFKK